jgi:rhodanese-related sulfurtransferase/DNA-binding MarR family transcriptional regulator
MRIEQRLSAAGAQVLTALAAVAHALAHPTRLKILNLLAQSEKTVTALTGLTGGSIAATSAHLRVLAAASLVNRRRRGREIHYSLASESVVRLTIALRQVGEVVSSDLIDARRAVFDTSDVRHVSPRQLAEDVRHGRVTLVDFRPPDEFAAGRLPGARSIPVDRIKQRVRSLPARTPVVGYCRGPYCVSAVTAVSLLRQHGVHATRLPFGVAEWKAAGYRLERGGTT